MARTFKSTAVLILLVAVLILASRGNCVVASHRHLLQGPEDLIFSPQSPDDVCNFSNDNSYSDLSPQIPEDYDYPDSQSPQSEDYYSIGD